MPHGNLSTPAYWCMTSFANSGTEPAAVPPPVYVVSGGVGASGEQLLKTALAHDDGQQVQDWVLADLVLVGVSRTGKTPLSIYLSVQGWKVANYPIVPDLPQPAELFQLRPGRVVALTIAPDQLLVLRQRRL